MTETSSVGGLQALFDDRVCTVEVDPHTLDARLLPEEQATATGMVEKRRREYAAGRHAARQALRTLGIEPAPILANAQRAPVWPAGAVGSISHTARWCGVAVAHASDYQSLGIDGEQQERVEPRLWAKVLTDAEHAWLTQQPKPDQARLATLIFSAKEAVYKCQHPLTGIYLGHRDVRVSLDPTRKHFSVLRCRADGAPNGEPFGPVHELNGRYQTQDGLVFTGLTLKS